MTGRLHEMNHSGVLYLIHETIASLSEEAILSDYPFKPESLWLQLKNCINRLDQSCINEAGKGENSYLECLDHICRCFPGLYQPTIYIFPPFVAHLV